MSFISYEKLDDEILVDDGEDRIGLPVDEFENWLSEENRLYHGMTEPDEFETPTGRWSIEAYWDCAPEYMILQHLNEFANVHLSHFDN
jgi:hypothetical protein